MAAKQGNRNLAIGGNRDHGRLGHLIAQRAIEQPDQGAGGTYAHDGGALAIGIADEGCRIDPPRTAQMHRRTQKLGHVAGDFIAARRGGKYERGLQRQNLS